DGRPGQRALRDILFEWLGFRTETVTRRTQYRLDKVTDRIHVLEGRMVVYLNVDEVIQTIRESDEPRPALMERFDLSERQAEDILEMRLRQLAKLEGFKIEKELAVQKEEQSRLEALLASPLALKRQIVKEIEVDARQYGDDRRTLIEVAEKAVLETKVVDEPVTVIVSQKGWLRARQGHGHDAGQFNFKMGDSLYDAIECRTTDNLVALSSTGRVYTVPVASLPSARGDGQPVTSLVDLEQGAQVVHMVAGDAEQIWFLGTQGGYGFMAKLKDMTTRQKAGKQFVTLEKGDVMLKPIGLQETDHALAMLTRKGRFLVVGLSEFKTLSGGGRGTILMGLDTGDHIEQWCAAGPAGVCLSGVYRNKQTDVVLDAAEMESYKGKRARKGRALAIKVKQPQLRRA
ncbi:MAG: DNA topoisomerase IV subunit A, partial [Pusillimonas sp.]|nr:DNA topoisomerase IV subunit A [Pusillimonas sp.]